MALPRPVLLAIAGAVLALMSFTSMRTLGARGTDELPAPAPAAQTAKPAAAAKPKPAAATKAEPSAAPKPAAKPKPAPKPLLADVPPATAKALAAGKLVVLLFTEPGAADDAATAQSFKAVSRIGSRVATFRASIADVGRYSGIVSGVEISQAPAIVIVRPDLKAVPAIEGYVESGYLLQQVRDQLP